MMIGLMLKFSSHFEFIFVYGERAHSNLTDLQWGCPAFLAPLEETVFFLMHILDSFVED